MKKVKIIILGEVEPSVVSELVGESVEKGEPLWVSKDVAERLIETLGSKVLVELNEG